MKLPTLLSGPIIRRTDPTQVTIWIATSKGFHIDANLYTIDKSNEITYQLLDTNTEVETIQVGKRLYVHLIKIFPVKKNFPTNQLLGYNLFFSGNASQLDLQSFGLLAQQNPHAIVYGDLDLPTFYINTEEENKVLYGSCRKPHSEGDDALTSADIVTEEQYLNVQDRPSALFLMGDQIYADDIPDPLSQFIFDLGRELIGKEEELSKLDNRLEKEPFKTAINQIHGRQFIMNHFAKLTSNHAANHLIQLGEYAAMYLLSYGPQLWDIAKKYGVFDSFEQVHENDTIYFVYPNKDCYRDEYEKELEQYRSRYTEQLKSIYRFQQNLFQIRRLLANTPTYMIFDDHDITDDWNLTIDWKNNVWNSPLGRHVVTNGLATYWAFQGWGNQPEAFDHRFKSKLTQYFNSLTIDLKAYEEFVHLLWEFDQWYFVAPTKPQAVFLDTRTMRAYDPQPKPTTIGTIIEENIRSPQLISEEGWKKISKQVAKSGYKEGRPLMVVSPTPLYGIGLIESVLLNYVYPLRTLGVSVDSMLDFEAWKYNGKGFNTFHEWIARWNPSHCFILSGDVHYASSVLSHVQFEDGRKTNIYQFTSSPLHNMSFTGVGGFLMKKVIWLNTLKRKRENIYRHCDVNNNLFTEDKNTPCPPKYNWREQIRYLSTKKGSIIETDNNLGLLTITSQSVQNTLFKYYDVYKHEKAYEAIDLTTESN